MTWRSDAQKTRLPRTWSRLLGIPGRTIEFPCVHRSCGKLAMDHAYTCVRVAHADGTRWWHSRVTCRVPTVRRGWLVVSFRRQFDTQTAWYVRKCAIRNSRWIIGNKGEKNSYFVIEPQEAKFREAQLFVAGRLSYRFYSFYTLSWKCLRDLSAYKNL